MQSSFQRHVKLERHVRRVHQSRALQCTCARCGAQQETVHVVWQQQGSRVRQPQLASCKRFVYMHALRVLLPHAMCCGSGRAWADRQPAHQPYQSISGRVAPWQQRISAIAPMPTRWHRTVASRRLCVPRPRADYDASCLVVETKRCRRRPSARARHTHENGVCHLAGKTQCDQQCHTHQSSAETEHAGKVRRASTRHRDDRTTTSTAHASRRARRSAPPS